jgi:hypothetical protein
MKAVPKPKKRPSRRGKVKRLDNAFSLYIRERDGWQCVTCGSRVKERLQCGHLFSRAAYSTRWDERNAYCQCASCNLYHEHDPYPLIQHFLSLYTQSDLDRLHEKYRTPVKLKDSEIDELIKHYEGRGEE